VEDAYLAFQVLMNLYQQMTEKKKGIEAQSFIHKTANFFEDQRTIVAQKGKFISEKNSNY